jgi:hypothetical protein
VRLGGCPWVWFDVTALPPAGVAAGNGDVVVAWAGSGSDEARCGTVAVTVEARSPPSCIGTLRPLRSRCRCLARCFRSRGLGLRWCAFAGVTSDASIFCRIWVYCATGICPKRL